MMRVGVIAALAFVGLAGCGGPNLDDARARALIGMTGPEHYAERSVAKNLTGRCNRYAYNARLANGLTEARAVSGVMPGSTKQGAVDLETTVKQRSLAAYYGQTDYFTLDPCKTLDQEVARQSPLSFLVMKKG